jgi:acyl-CoA synthetase (NDP forming)
MNQLDIEKTITLLKKYKLPFLDYKLADSPDKAALIAKKAGFPVAMKVASVDVIHKSDVGGVKVGISDEQQAKISYNDIIRSVKKKMPKAKVKGVYIQKMGQGTEVIVGMKRDAQFGPVIMFGLGGIFVEIFKDTSLKLAPIDRKKALDMISEIKSSSILKGARGKKPANIDALVNLLVKISKIAERREIVEFDFNPILVNEKNAVIADARIIVQ